MNWLEESVKRSKKLRTHYMLRDVDIYIKDQLPEGIDVDFVINYRNFEFLLTIIISVAVPHASSTALFRLGINLACNISNAKGPSTLKVKELFLYKVGSIGTIHILKFIEFISSLRISKDLDHKFFKSNYFSLLSLKIDKEIHRMQVFDFKI